jgi:hypothetical protein
VEAIGEFPNLLLGFAWSYQHHLTLRLVSQKGWLSRYCHGSRGKTLENYEQKVNTKEKLALVLHRNSLILLGKHPLRQNVIKQN